MRNSIKQLDQLLRGTQTDPARLRDADLAIDVRGMWMLICILAMSYGLFMGAFALARGLESGQSQPLRDGLLQMVASTTKMPLLYFSTVFITFPSLYVFSALSGSRLQIKQVVSLLAAALAINLAVLASLGPIVAFFSVSTPSYHFVLLLNVVCCAVAGILGLAFLLQTLYRMTDPGSTKPAAALQQSDAVPAHFESTINATLANRDLPGPLETTSEHILGKHVRKVFWTWIFVFGLVGLQMGWVLRPFIGSPNAEFSWFRMRDSNVIQAILSSFWRLFG